MQLAGRQVARLTIDASGKTLQCRVIQSEGVQPAPDGCDDLVGDLFERPGIAIGAVEATMVRTAFATER
jgi:hypothetical protein